MKAIQAPILSVQRTNPMTGKALIVERTIKGAKESIAQAIVTCKYGQFWLPSDAVSDEHNQINLTLHEEGDTFVAQRDSTRTKGEVMGDKCPAGKEDEALYFKGDTVTRTSETYVANGTQKAIEQAISFEDKLKLMAQYGVTVKL